MKNLYDEDYYERGVESGKSCYSNFRWIPELTIPMCSTICDFLKISTKETILDFGCAKGYVVKSLRLLNRNAWGVDISEYAISQADSDVKSYLYHKDFKLQNNEKYDWILSKDVFEHIKYSEIEELLNELRNSCKKMFCVVPLGQNGKYIVPSYELDTTHIIRESKDWWEQLFLKCGFNISYSSYRIEHLKDNYKQYQNGNGFFVLE